jgi:hypothetical protein
MHGGDALDDDEFKNILKWIKSDKMVRFSKEDLFKCNSF